MGDWVTYRYITHLEDNTPDNVLDLLETAYIASKSKDDKWDNYFKGENEFLNHLNVLFFDRSEKTIVLYGRSKYFRNREHLKSFIKWIKPYIYFFDRRGYQGSVYGSDYSDYPPRLIFDDELRDFDQVQKYHDEEFYQTNYFASRVIRLSPHRAQALEDLLQHVETFLTFLKNNSRKKLRMSPETRKLISLVNELKDSQNQQNYIEFKDEDEIEETNDE